MSQRKRLHFSERGRLRAALGFFFVALAVPTSLLVRQAYLQLKWESFHQYSVLAETAARRIDERLRQWIEAEESRSFTDYTFLVVAGDPAANFLQRSPLSDFPPKAGLPGLLGYFQVDNGGQFSTPLLPAREQTAPRYGISPQESADRLAVQEKLLEILQRNRLVQGRRDLQEAERRAIPESVQDQESSAPGANYREQSASARGRNAISEAAQAAFDKLSSLSRESSLASKQETGKALGRIEDMKLAPAPAAAVPEEKADAALEKAMPQPQSKRAVRKEQSALPEPAAPRSNLAGRPARRPLSDAIRVTTFESEIDPFEFNRLESGHFVLFRKVWRNGQRYIQGILLDGEPLLRGVAEAAFRETVLPEISRLSIAHRGDVLLVFGGAGDRYALAGASELRGELLYRSRLSAPLGDMELIFSVERLPAGPGAVVVGWLAGILAVLLSGGFYLLYRLGLRQIEVNRQQQDFVSAVSHELKTPLTSIRMYGEMLREGWAPEDKKAGYYDYICIESERLSRLIANVLQLARLTRSAVALELKTAAAGDLLDEARSRIASQVERAGFELRVVTEPEAAAASLRADGDAFVQIFINLVDNALKFAAGAPQKIIELGCRRTTGQMIEFRVRDYGPGVPKGQMKKIFQLFYRSENELTRETVGTGIGLALVRYLAAAMDARVEVADARPGAEFLIRFPRAQSGEGSRP